MRGKNDSQSPVQMSKRKGVSADEKRIRLLDLFYEKKEFFQLKELEKLAPKEKGIVAQSVKEVLQNLVDDGLVDTDKIGTSIYFWAFPSKTKTERKLRLENLIDVLEKSKLKLNMIKEKLIEETVGREDLAERDEIGQKLIELQQIKDDLIKKLSCYSHCDPEYLCKIKHHTVKIKDAINRWTENVILIRTWCVNKTQIDSETFNKHFNISEEFDYI